MMQTDAIEVTFRGISPSESIEVEIRERIQWLERFHSDLASCHVVVDLPRRRRPRYGVVVGVALAVRCGPLFVVSHEAAAPRAEAAKQTPCNATGLDRRGREDEVSLAVHEVFDAMRRCVQEFTGGRRGSLTVQ